MSGAIFSLDKVSKLKALKYIQYNIPFVKIVENFLHDGFLDKNLNFLVFLQNLLNFKPTSWIYWAFGTS